MRVAKMPHIYSESRRDGKKTTTREVYYRRFPKDVQEQTGQKFIHKWPVGTTRQQANEDTRVPARFNQLVHQAREQGGQLGHYSQIGDPHFGYPGQRLTRYPQNKRFIAGIEVPLNFSLQAHLRQTLGAAAPAEGTVDYETLIQLWKDTRATEGHAPKDKAVRAKSRKLRLLFEWIGQGNDLSIVTPAHLQGYKEHLMRLGVERDEATLAHDHLTDIKYLFKFAEENHKLTAGDPAEKLKVPRKATGVPRKPFTAEEARTLLLSARASNVPIIKWGHWLSAYTGVIISEILQARRGEFKLIEGIWVFDMSERTEMKTAYRPRGVPLHYGLIDEGFLEFLETSPYGEAIFQIGDTQASNLLMEHIRGCGISRFETNLDGRITGEKVHYSWRHGFISQLEDLTTPDRSRFLAGHAAKDVHARNYLHHNIGKLKEAIDGITYPLG